MASRRVAILMDAAIDVIAETGMRGLTHRAVDLQAGLPPGSTSAYFRTREALITGLVGRLAELDQAEITRDRLDAGETAEPAPGLAPGLAPADLDRLALGVATLLDRWLTTGRNRSLARYACLLEATHRQRLRGILAHGATIRAQARALLARTGAPDPHRRADHLVAYIDGLLFDRLVGAGTRTAPAPGTAESREDLAQAVRAALHAIVDSPAWTRPDVG